MSIKFENSFILRILFGATLALLLSLGIVRSGLAADEAGVRSSVSTHTVAGGRGNDSASAVTKDEFGALIVEGSRSTAETRGSSSKPGAGSNTAESAGFDFWIYDIDVDLFNDDDVDGYFHGIDVLFDVDTNFSAADIYAVLYLSFEGGPWNEYADTEDFTIFGSSGSDEYVLVSELMSGYPTGSYDLLIEIFDSYDGTFLASHGPIDSSEMSFLPLEDFNRDAPFDEVQVVVSQGGGGAIDAWLLNLLLLVLFASAARKIWRHRNDGLVRIDSPAPIWRKN